LAIKILRLLASRGIRVQESPPAFLHSNTPDWVGEKTPQRYHFRRFVLLICAELSVLLNFVIPDWVAWARDKYEWIYASGANKTTWGLPDNHVKIRTKGMSALIKIELGRRRESLKKEFVDTMETAQVLHPFKVEWNVDANMHAQARLSTGQGGDCHYLF
jgi:hypothetical protein